MKNIILFILAFFAVSNCFGQEDMRASIRSHGLKIDAYVKPGSPVTFPNSGSNNNVAIIMVFSLPAGGAMNTNNAPVPVSISCTPFPGIAFNSYPVALINDRFIYTYYNNPVGVVTQTTWPANQEKLLLTLTFGPAVVGMLPRLDNYWNSGGGPNFFDYFYFELNSAQLSDTFGDPFYNGNEGTYGSGDQYVEAINPLPVKLLSFSADKSGDKSAQLNWSTASESNSNYFGIERSYDKITWKNAGQVKAAGSSQIILNYSFLDKNVYNGTASDVTVYYRLKMVDLDNSFEYSPIESVHFGNGRDAIVNGNEFLVYPNPASEGVHIEWDADQPDQPTSFEFYDLSGKLIYTQKVEDQTNEQYVDFTKTNIQTGLCLMRVMSGDKSIEHKQIVVGQNH